jgi:NTE family protein
MVKKQKTALVLSAGGMFGAYQAGAWQTIGEHVHPQIVVGASVGALNGWPVAGGCGPGHLVERWMEPTTAEVLKLRHDKGFRKGWFDPDPLRNYAKELYASYTPQVPFGLVVVKLSGLAQRLVKYPDVTAEHLQATASIPICLPTVRIGGDRYLDGGLMEKLPVWAAIEMGATRIIAIDCMRISNWWIRVGMSAFRRLKRRRKLPPELDITIVTPEAPLGGWNDAVFWKQRNIERWIAQGARDAARAITVR